MIIVIVCGSVVGILCLAGGIFLQTSGAFSSGTAKTRRHKPTRPPAGAPEPSERGSLWGFSKAHLDSPEASGKKISLKALDSTRVQESYPGGEFLRAAFSVSSDMVHADGQAAISTVDHSEDSSEIAGDRIEATLLGADMEEEEPEMVTVSYTPEVLAGSVGRFGTGMKPKLHSFRPAAREADTSLVWNAPGPEGKMVPVSLTVDLVVQSPHGEEEIVLEEDEPDMNTPLATPQVSIRAVLQGKQGQASRARQDPDVPQDEASIHVAPNAGADDRRIETNGLRSQVPADEIAVEGAAAEHGQEHGQADDVDAGGVEDAVAQGEEEQSVVSAVDAIESPEQNAGSKKKRSFFSSSMFSFPRKKAVYEEYTISVHSGSDAADGTPAEGREREETTDELPLDTASKGSQKVEAVPDIAVPSLADGMGLETEFEEAEPGEFSTSHLPAGHFLR